MIDRRASIAIVWNVIEVPFIEQLEKSNFSRAQPRGSNFRQGGKGSYSEIDLVPDAAIGTATVELDTRTWNNALYGNTTTWTAPIDTEPVGMHLDIEQAIPLLTETIVRDFDLHPIRQNDLGQNTILNIVNTDWEIPCRDDNQLYSLRELFEQLGNKITEVLNETHKDRKGNKLSRRTSAKRP